VAAQTQWTRVQRLSPKNKEVSPYILASRLQEQNAKLNPHIAACDFIGYFVSLLLCDLHVSILKFYLSALPSPLPVSSSEHSLSVSFLASPFLFQKLFNATLKLL
jgi:hypothetical protein